MTEHSVAPERAHVRVEDTLELLGEAATDAFVRAVLDAVRRTGGARIVFASASSQLPLWETCLRRDDVPWDKVTAFHMDEYVGIGIDGQGSLAGYLERHLLGHVQVGQFHPIRGDSGDPQREATRYAALLAEAPIDICVLGIGENGHIAFNDPPADFDTAQAVAVVELLESGRRQQVGEGHFPSLDDVPKSAITLTIPTLLAARTVIGVVPDIRKAPAVRDALRGPLSPMCPASILATRSNVSIFLDAAAASLLDA